MSSKPILQLGLSAFVIVLTIALRAQDPLDVDSQLASLKERFNAAADREAVKPRSEAFKVLNEGYLSALGRALRTATNAGNLEQAVTIRAETERIERSEPIPNDEDKMKVAVLRPLRETFSDGVAKVDADYLKRLRPIADRYEQSLAALQKELTKAGRFDLALRVKAIRDQLVLVRVKGDLQLMRAPDAQSPRKSVYGITLISASYRVVDDPGRSVDVITNLQAALESGAESIVVITKNLGKNDPATGQKKQLVLGYKYAGSVKEKVFPEGSTLVFNTDLK